MKKQLHGLNYWVLVGLPKEIMRYELLSMWVGSRKIIMGDVSKSNIHT